MNVIQECAQLFARQQCSRHPRPEFRWRRHQWVPLFSTLSLRALVNAALVLWDFALRDPVANSHEQIYGVAVIQERISGVRKNTLLVLRKSRGVNSANCQRMFCGPTPLASGVRTQEPLLTFWQAALALSSGVRCPDASGTLLRDASLIAAECSAPQCPLANPSTSRRTLISRHGLGLMACGTTRTATN